MWNNLKGQSKIRHDCIWYMKNELFIYYADKFKADVTGMMSVEIIETNEQGLKSLYVK